MALGTRFVVLACMATKKRDRKKSKASKSKSLAKSKSRAKPAKKQETTIPEPMPIDPQADRFEGDNE